MTEQDWLASTDPAAMWRFLTEHSFGPSGLARENEEKRQRRRLTPSERKMRLFACAISRRMVMRYSLPDIGSVEDACDDPATDWNRFISPTAGASCGYWCAEPDIQNGLAELLRGDFAMHNGKDAANLLREIVGNPWRPVTLPAAEYLHFDGDEVRSTPILSRHRYATPDVLSLATAAYEERPEDGSLDPVRLAVLADALEEAGCTNEYILRHLRGWEWCPPGAWRGRDTWRGCGDWISLRGPHVRGCWCLDLLLGKE